MSYENQGLQTYNRVIRILANRLQNFEYVNNVTTGDLFEIDLNKRTMFPLVHIIVNSVNFGGDSGIMTFNITFMAMDMVNEFKEQDNTINPLIMGEDNEQFVLQNTLAVLNKLNEFLFRGSLHTGEIASDRAGTCEPFFDRFENRLAGWSYTQDIMIANNITICNNY